MTDPARPAPEERPKIGDRIRFSDGSIISEGTITDLRPRCLVCGEWHESDVNACGDLREVRDPDYDRLAFVAVPGWPHMHKVLLNGREVFVEGVWRSPEAAHA